MAQLHPGQRIKQMLDDAGLTINGVAIQIGYHRRYFNQVCNGKKPISPELALRLADHGYGTAALWMKVQSAWDLQEARKRMQLKNGKRS